MKKIILILLVLFIIFSLTFTSFATDWMVPNDGRSNYVCLYINSKPYVLTSNSEFYVKVINGEYNLCNDNVIYSYTSWTPEGQKITSGIKWVFDVIEASNNNIINQTDGTVFFSIPKVSPLLSTLSAIPQLPKKIWKIILVGLIPLSGLVISAICFRKAWAFLHNQLQH